MQNIKPFFPIDKKEVDAWLFKKGDRVLVHPDLQKCFEGALVSEEMLKYAGKEFTIEKSIKRSIV